MRKYRSSPNQVAFAYVLLTSPGAALDPQSMPAGAQAVPCQIVEMSIAGPGACDPPKPQSPGRFTFRSTPGSSTSRYPTSLALRRMASFRFWI